MSGDAVRKPLNATVTPVRRVCDQHVECGNGAAGNVGVEVALQAAAIKEHEIAAAGSALALLLMTVGKPIDRKCSAEAPRQKYGS